MGPGFVSPDFYKTARGLVGAESLQWGRASSARISRTWELVGDGYPCFNGAGLRQPGFLRYKTASFQERLASMGPGFVSPDFVVIERPACVVTRLQWGRASSARISRIVVPIGLPDLLLQWGRASSA